MLNHKAVRGRLEFEHNKNAPPGNVEVVLGSQNGPKPKGMPDTDAAYTSYS